MLGGTSLYQTAPATQGIEFRVSCRMTVLISMYMQVHIYVALLFGPFTLYPQSWCTVLAVQVTVHAVYYAFTLPGDPAVSGCRTRSAFQAWARSQVGPVLDWWMRGCKVCCSPLAASSPDDSPTIPLHSLAIRTPPSYLWHVTGKTVHHFVISTHVSTHKILGHAYLSKVCL
jgi:hypothetical protein